MTQTPLLRVRNLAKAFGGTRAVDHVNFELPAGRVQALIGPNGAGKTTLFNLLTGHLRADSGSVIFREKEILGLPPHAVWRRGISRTFQVPAIFENLTLLENVQVALRSHERRLLRPLPLAQAPTRAAELVAAVQLCEPLQAPAYSLAYGNRKRLELAIALANEPALLLLDEPTAGLAPSERARLMQLVHTIATRQSITILFTEHDMDVVFEQAHYVFVMHQGSLIEQGTPEEVRANRRVQEVYLGEAESGSV
ncbi:MAG: ABC transporter ATP-binding protein [Candidatus Tectomicrobia bacterium]|nr:ABC transporter ATP-binding protein [Candidatus Tectomicrobia bacterium]